MVVKQSRSKSGWKFTVEILIKWSMRRLHSSKIYQLPFGKVETTLIKKYCFKLMKSMPVWWNCLTCHLPFSYCIVPCAYFLHHNVRTSCCYTLQMHITVHNPRWQCHKDKKKKRRKKHKIWKTYSQRGLVWPFSSSVLSSLSFMLGTNSTLLCLVTTNKLLTSLSNCSLSYSVPVVIQGGIFPTSGHRSP